MKNKYKPEEWHTFFRINNSTLLRMYLYDGHLHGGIVIDDTTKNNLEKTILSYCDSESKDDNKGIDKCIINFGQLFAHPALGIEELMEEYIRNQRQISDNIHRGHIKHSLGCVLLAHFLLEFDANCLLQTRPKPPTIEKYPRSEVIPNLLLIYPHKGYFLDPFLWLLFFHDWGYIRQVTCQFSKSSADFAKVTELGKVLQDSFMFKKKKKKSMERLWNFIKIKYNTDRDHGVASSLILLKKLGQIPEKTTKAEADLIKKLKGGLSELKKLKRQYYCETLSAIALHNLPLDEHKYRFKITDNVYFFLLKLVDEIVDWSMPVMDYLWRPIEPLDHILLNVRPLTKKAHHDMLIQAIVNFKDNAYLFQGSKRIEDFDKNGELFEVRKLKEKAKALRVLDFKELNSNRRWLNFEMILIDRNGRVHHLYWDDDKPIIVSEEKHEPIF